MDASPHLPHRRRLVVVARWIVAVAAVFGLVAVAFHQLAKTLPVPSPPVAADTASLPPPDFRFATLDGSTLGPPDFSGQVVVVDVWATWCGPCRLQASYLEHLHQELGDDDGVRFLAVSIGEDAETVRNFVKDDPFPYPVLLDPDQELSSRYQIYVLPTVMIVDPQGRISYLHPGISDTETLKQEIRKAQGADTTA